EAAGLGKEGAGAAQPEGGTGTHVVGRTRRGRRGPAAALAGARRESGRRGNHLKDETPDDRYAEADRGPRRLRPRQRRRRGAPGTGRHATRSAGARGLGAAGSRRPLLRKLAW